ncbi:MAG: BrnT family toxin [Rectinemataceae bacterium]
MERQSLQFEWDAAKDRANRKKHGLMFSNVISVFRDPDIFTIYDEQHSELEEDRWISIGLTEKGLVCVVTHTYWKENGIEAVRIISARKAGGTEEKQYFFLKGR